MSNVESFAFFFFIFVFRESSCGDVWANVSLDWLDKKGKIVIALTAIINHVMLVNISTNAVYAVTSSVSTTRR